MAEEEKLIQEEIRLPVILADRLIKSATEAESFKSDCAELAKQADRLILKLSHVDRLAAAASTTQPLYERPIRRISSDVSKNLDRALTLVRKCKHRGFLRQVFTITANADFKKVATLLDASIADVTWLLSIFDSDGGANLSLPPIASNDPILAMLWSSIVSVQMGQDRDRIDAANNLASLARDNDRNKKMIFEEGGLAPLLKLLKEGASPDAQIAAATALFNLGNNQERVRSIAGELAVPMIVQVLGDSPMRVQIAVANLVAKMAEMDPEVKEEFGRQNITRPLMTLLSADVVLDDSKLQSNKASLHSLVQINKELTSKPFHRTHHMNSSLSVNNKERWVESVSPELKLELKINCAKASWKLSRESLLISRKITETKGLFCLAKIIENESEELQVNCLMTVMEITAVAEANSDLRRTAFKPNLPAAKAVLEQLLRVVNKESSPLLLIPAIKSIGSLARTFPAKETRIVGPLVSQLAHMNANVATEAAIALTKFVCPDNFNWKEHSKSIVEFGGVSNLMNLLRTNGRDRVHELVLLCYLALDVSNSKALEEVRALNVLEGAARWVVAHHPELRELFAKALHNLTLYQVGIHTHRQAHAP